MKQLVMKQGVVKSSINHIHPILVRYQMSNTKNRMKRKFTVRFCKHFWEKHLMTQRKFHVLLELLQLNIYLIVNQL